MRGAGLKNGFTWGETQYREKKKRESKKSYLLYKKVIAGRKVSRGEQRATCHALRGVSIEEEEEEGGFREKEGEATRTVIPDPDS